jgi:hypothetical protein
LWHLAYEAVHQQQSGSREAMGHFLAHLRQRPDDLGVPWLLAIAAMTLGEYPARVPKQYLLTSDLFASTLDIGRFPNIAARVTLDTRGPNQFGSCLFDDFTGDCLPDLFVCSADCDLDPALFVNCGDR